MKAEFVNPFIQSAENILKTTIGETTSLGKVSLKNAPFPNACNISIEIIGALKGIVYYSMDTATACSIASKMMMGMPVESLDDMSKSALCELSNIISGSVSTAFSNMGFLTDIKPPIFNNDFASAKEEKLLSVPINLSDNKVFEINIWLDD